MFYQQPPVGNPVCLGPRSVSGGGGHDVFAGWSVRYFASGTAALAAAIISAVRLKEVARPEVIIPAYGCPDLVSAVIYAGARPVLVDLEPDRPWMDLGRVSSATGPNTVAIVPASLLGIPERIDELKKLAYSASAVLIEDSAQSFPHGGEENYWEGDLVVLSFGRGKPVSLLGGGALLYRDNNFSGLLPDNGADSETGKAFRFYIQATLYNLLLSPRLYWIPQRLPFLHLGETRFHPLHAVEALDDTRHALLATNISAYRSYPRSGQSAVAELVRQFAADDCGLIDLPVACGIPGSRKLLRYPLLIEGGRRDSVYSCLREKGQGGALMYPSILPGIPGLQGLFADAGEFPAASKFASNLLTLPAYSRMRDADLAGIGSCLALCR